MEQVEKSLEDFLYLKRKDIDYNKYFNLADEIKKIEDKNILSLTLQYLLQTDSITKARQIVYAAQDENLSKNHNMCIRAITEITKAKTDAIAVEVQLVATNKKLIDDFLKFNYTIFKLNKMENEKIIEQLRFFLNDGDIPLLDNEVYKYIIDTYATIKEEKEAHVLSKLICSDILKDKNLKQSTRTIDAEMYNYYLARKKQ